MSDEAAPLDTGPSLAPEAAPPVAAPTAEAPAPTVTESLAATFDRIQEREGNAPGQRGPDGKFAPRPGAAPQITDQPTTEGNEPPPAAIEAPQSWSAEMKAQFAALPPAAQQYVAQRESEAHAKISEQGNKLKAFDGLSQVLEPRRQELMASYGSVERGLSDLMALHARYHTDPVSVIAGLAQGAGIRLDQLPQLAAQAPQAQQPTDPRIAALSQEVAGLKSIHQQKELAAAQSVVDAFKAKPEAKHYAAVESRIAELLNAGAAHDLPSAYEMATWADPKIRALLLADQAAADKAKADAEAKKLATLARAANVVNIRSTGGRAANTVKPASIRESLMKAYDQANGAA